MHTEGILRNPIQEIVFKRRPLEGLVHKGLAMLVPTMFQTAQLTHSDRSKGILGFEPGPADLQSAALTNEMRARCCHTRT